MRIISKILAGVAGMIVAAIIGIGMWLWLAPPEILRVADGYAAKIVCSNVFLAHRDPEQVLAEDVQAPGNPLLKLVKIKSHSDSAVAQFAGYVAPAGAREVFHEFGCTLNHKDPKIENLYDTLELSDFPKNVALPSDKLWPLGAKVEIAPSPELTKILSDTALTGPGMRAVVVVKDGKIVAETYGKGFGPDTPLIGWSMTKSVNAAIVGRAYMDGKLKLTDDHLMPQWTDDRAKITIADLLAMKSGLQFNEDYGDVSDVTRMLYLEPDMAKFVASKPLTHPHGTYFSYSTGTATLLSRIWQDRVGKDDLAYPRAALFNPLGMSSAVFETDEAGTFVGGSYLYADARDWARFGQFLLQDGVWNGKRLLPEDFMAMMRTSNGSDDGYTQAQTWLTAPGEYHLKDRTLPQDTIWLNGHDGQSVAMIPSHHMVVVRLGLTPSKMKYRPSHLVAAILAAK